MRLSPNGSAPSPVFAPPGSAAGNAPMARALSSVPLLDAAPTGRISFATDKARTLLEKYFSNPTQLPEALMRCLGPEPANGTPVLLPWIAEDGAKQLAVRLMGRQDGHFQLLLEEKAYALSADRLQSALTLTPREAEVLLWITRGKTSPEIASIVACKPATVAKHTERIFAKLGVETRTAAAGLALEAMGDVCPGSAARSPQPGGSGAGGHPHA